VSELTEPRYPFVAIDVPASLAEVAAEQLFALGAEGVEQRDTTTLVRGAQSPNLAPEKSADPGAHVGVPTETPEPGDEETVTLVAAFPTREAALEAMSEIDDDLNPRLEEVIGDAWRDAWKEHFAPFRLSPRIVIKPPWREVDQELAKGAHVLELEPGRAFGTGLHATTSLVANVLDAHASEYAGKNILDLGCGSGILSLVALSLGASGARAVDVDPDAVRITIENAERCGFADRVEADTTAIGELGSKWPVVLANIQAEVLVPLAADVIARVEHGGLLVLSGILETQKDRVLAAYRALQLLEAPSHGEWIALVMRAA
jgi:ribosomal protein L11 methyltransferase